MTPKLFAFDLDGTLLNDKKVISPANVAALEEMSSLGIHIVLASGRLGSSMSQFIPHLKMDVGLLTLNGAAVYMDQRNGGRCVYNATLENQYSDYLIQYAADKHFALNFYFEDHLYTVNNARTKPWIDLYYAQTSTSYVYMDDLRGFLGRSPSKIIFVGDNEEINVQEELFRKKWDAQSVYVCRTWAHYLEFLNVRANKGDGLTALSASYGIDMKDVVAFGDAENDLPMLRSAGLGIAMKNGNEETRRCAKRVTEFTNDEDGIFREWVKLKEEFFS